MSRRILVLVLALSMTSMFGMAGCATESESKPTPEPVVSPTPTPPEEPAARSDVRIYLVRGEKIGVAGRSVPDADDKKTVIRQTVEELVKGPNADEEGFGLLTTIPDGTTVNGVTIANGTATVDLSKEFESGGGSLSMQLRVAQVVCTLTQFDEVKNVAFQIDGEKVETIGGEGVIVDPPVDRSDFEQQLPPVLVETPVPGQTVSSPLVISGSSNVFEATHQLNVTDPDGLIVVEEVVTATSGTGTRGTWTTTVDFPTPKFDGLGSVIVFTLSAKDGKKTDVVEIPVRMKK